ncbi:hypothetical protein CHS0354_036865 [Potamilus streckersoni]|uniref:Uncharacterized protein n=1 Tax=Potamilus streckersoni TaxID=2493646 RepID=A0AAE0S0G7_9BIVA|nr:hypothetical protein CHS0354_036865 [Potamilus streckersoni]
MQISVKCIILFCKNVTDLRTMTKGILSLIQYSFEKFQNFGASMLCDYVTCNIQGLDSVFLFHTLCNIVCLHEKDKGDNSLKRTAMLPDGMSVLWISRLVISFNRFGLLQKF